ncbi:MAG: hypothetical protein HQL17_01090 [Candidatus Omnitrophica bacterium]|nr:hypothetical protein [Candidatus Omnitrophota bacterium]
MEKLALKIGGLVFILIGFLHVVRVVMQVPVTVGQLSIPLGASVLGAVLALALGGWMLTLVCGCLKK